MGSYLMHFLNWSIVDLHVVLITAIQQSDSVIHIYIYIHSFLKYSFPLWFILGYWIQFSVLYSRIFNALWCITIIIYFDEQIIPHCTFGSPLASLFFCDVPVILLHFFTFWHHRCLGERIVAFLNKSCRFSCLFKQCVCVYFFNKNKTNFKKMFLFQISPSVAVVS